jgi:glycosyltransferase involved in cell wall biosynthesis
VRISEAIEVGGGIGVSGCSVSHNTVGILIPTYNRLTLLQKSLASVLDQTHQALEVVVIDNGSTDGTAAHMATLNDPRVRYVVNDQNLGLIGSINKGIGLMSEKVAWCTILCDDDLLEKEYAAQMLRFVDSHKGIGVVYAPLAFIDAEGILLRSGMTGPESESPLSYLKARSKNRRETYLTGVFFARQLFDAIGGYPSFTTGMATDDAFLFHLGVKGGAIGCNMAAKAYIRLHEGSESVSLAGGLLKHFQALLDFRQYCCTVASDNGLAGEGAVACWIAGKIKLWLNAELIKVIRASIADRSGVRKREALGELREVMGALDGYLSLRFRTDFYLYERFDLFLENHKLYYALWRVIRN